MSDLCLNELDDIAWDEFFHGDDHIVPHPSCGRANESMSQNDSRKKPRHEVIDLPSSLGDQSTGKYANKLKEQVLPLSSTRSTAMLEKNSWADAPGVVFPCTYEKDCVKEVSSLAAENTTTLSNCFESNNIDSTESESCHDGHIDGKNAAVGKNSISCPLGPISQADDNLSFFDNNPEDKDSNELLYYSWSEIGNFEDVDRMFRSCDSTFGLGAGKEDELGWFSSSDVVEQSGDGLMSDFKFPCPAYSAPEDTCASHETSRTKETYSPINSSGTENQLLRYNGSFWPSEKDESSNLSQLSFVSGSTNSDCKLVPEKKKVELNGGVQVKISSTNQPRIASNVMTSMHKKHSKHQSRSEGKGKGAQLENGGTLHYTDSLQEETKRPTGATRTQVNFTYSGIQQQKQAHGPDFGYLQSSFSYMPSDYRRSDQSAPHATLSINKSESSGLTSLPLKDSYASNQMQPMESSPDPSFQVSAVIANKKVEKLLQHSGIKFESSSNLESVRMGISAELGSSIVQECSSISPGLDEISEEAASFHQLQRVTEQLDTRTKLRIRDSLYRLARSAEQRHIHANVNNGSGDDRDTNGALISEGTNKCTSYMDLETDTNPIDRSIAHLLFHRPSGSSVTPAHDSLALKSPSMIHGSSTNAPLMGENLICHGEVAAETKRDIVDA